MSDISGFWRSAFTSADNRTGDLGRVHWSLTHAAAVLFQGFAVVHGSTFDPVTFAAAHGGIAAAFAGALKLKSTTEPPVTP